MSLQPRLGTEPCPDENVLARLAGGALSRLDAEGLEAHLDGCPECRRLVAAVASGDSREGGASAPTQLDTGAPTLPLEGGWPAPRPGEALGRYVVREWLGAGGMGVVYAAEDPRLGRRVALKLLRRAGVGAEGDEARARLLREAQAMARLSHPNVLPVFDLGTTADGQVFLAMELVEGPTLAEWLRACERPWREVLEVFLGAGRGLAAAHRAGLVHRDFKPANVLVGEDGRARVTDFGLVREAHGPASPESGAGGGASDATLTRVGAVAGTPAYMSPEQHAGRAVDARGDQFSYCVALHEALHGERPFAEDASGEARWRKREAATGARLPRHVREALARGLSLAPEARFESMDALLEALERPAALRWRRRALGVGAALGLVAVGLALWPQGREQVLAARQATKRELIELKVGEKRVLRVPGLKRVALGELGLVEARVLPDGALELEALDSGASHLLVWDEAGRRREFVLSVTLR